MTRAHDVILAGTHDARLLLAPGTTARISSMTTPYDLMTPEHQKRAMNAPKATNQPYPPSGGTNTSASASLSSPSSGSPVSSAVGSSNRPVPKSYFSAIVIT